MLSLKHLLAQLPGGQEEYCLQVLWAHLVQMVQKQRLNWRKPIQVAIQLSVSPGGYHGMTHGALAMTGNLSAKNAVNGLMPGVQFMPLPA